MADEIQVRSLQEDIDVDKLTAPEIRNRITEYEGYIKRDIPLTVDELDRFNTLITGKGNVYVPCQGVLKELGLGGSIDEIGKILSIIEGLKRVTGDTDNIITQIKGLVESMIGAINRDIRDILDGKLSIRPLLKAILDKYRERNPIQNPFSDLENEINNRINDIRCLEGLFKNITSIQLGISDNITKSLANLSPKRIKELKENPLARTSFLSDQTESISDDVSSKKETEVKEEAIVKTGKNNIEYTDDSLSKTPSDSVVKFDPAGTAELISVEKNYILYSLSTGESIKVYRDNNTVIYTDPPGAEMYFDKS